MALSAREEEKLTLLVDALEATSSAEVVVAVANQSGHYYDLELAWPVISAWVITYLLIFSPFTFPDWSLTPAVIIAFCFGFGLSRLPQIRRLLPIKRCHHQVEQAAQAAFFKEHVSATRGRTGILIYLSLREKDLEILTDYGVQAVIAPSHWNEIKDKVRKVNPKMRWQTLVDALEPTIPLLAQKLPRSDDDQNELSNAVRMIK